MQQIETAVMLHYFMQLVNIGSQYSYSSSDQSEFLVIVSRLVDDRPEKDSHTTVKERVSLTYHLLIPLVLLPSHSRSKIKAQECNIFIVQHTS